MWFSHKYLSDRKQRIKVNDAYSPWKDIFYDVPQRSVLGSLLFNICLLFLEDPADDSTIYMGNKKESELLVH